MTLFFKYKTIRRPDGTEVKPPSIPLIFGGKEKIEVIGLLDSGADISAIPMEMAEILGLDLNGKKNPAFGVGGEVDAIDTEIEVNIKKGHEDYKFKMPVKVILEDYDLPVLLGRAGFFDKFVITFNQDQEKVSLKKVA